MRKKTYICMRLQCKSNMKRLFLFVLVLLSLSLDALSQKAVSGVYVGGHIRRERPGTITTLRNSGFTYALLFNVHVDADGTLMTDGETICKNGQYVFANTQPYYQQDVANLKREPTSIQRIEIVVGGWGNDSYDHIRDLINANGTGASTMLYRNFKALKEAIPEIDAVNNDDEHCYDVESAAKFHIMMANLGYATTLAPYTYKSFWTQLSNKIRATKPNAVERVMVQCYDGGAGNVGSVGTWNFTGVQDRHAGLLYYSNDWSVDKNMAQFQAWKDDGVATGGFVWVYNNEEWDLNAWASGINRVFGAMEVPEDEVVVKCYSEKNYTGYCVSLPEGQFSQADLAVYGLKAKDLSSMELVNENYQVRFFKSTNCTGTYLRRRASSKMFSTAYDNQICSIIIEPLPTAIDNVCDDDDLPDGDNAGTANGKGLNGKCFNLAGQQLRQPAKGINIVNGKKIVKP